MTSWMVVTSADNYQRTIDLGFVKQGFKSRQRRRVMENMKPGDNLLYYVTAVQVFAATATITSEGFEEHELIWLSKPGEDYPWRVEVKADRVPAEEDWIPTHMHGPALEYMQKWPAKHWKLAFQGNLHQIPDADFATIRQALAGTKQIKIPANPAKKAKTEKTAVKKSAPKKKAAPVVKTVAAKKAVKKPSAKRS
ncbi:EVE domain [Actinobacteria bacterium IMCC26256]|nr:EVE domain [Actinobacteria bacterium IMCC26256]